MVNSKRSQGAVSVRFAARHAHLGQIHRKSDRLSRQDNASMAHVTSPKIGPEIMDLGTK